MASWSPHKAPKVLRAPELRELLKSTAAWAGFETLERMEKERDDRVIALKKAFAHAKVGGARRKRLSKLISALESCCKERRCGSSACPICRRDARTLWISYMLSLWLGDTIPLEHVKSVTLLHVEWIIPAGQLRTFAPRTITDRFRKQLQRVEFRGAMIGGIDVAFDLERGVWVLHLHFIVEGLTSEIERKLRALYPNSDHIDKPMMVKLVNNPFGQFSYAIKSFPDCRTHYEDNQGRTNTPPKMRRVPEPHHTEYLLWVHQFPISDLMMVVGVRSYGGQLLRKASCQRGNASKRSQKGGNDRHSLMN